MVSDDKITEAGGKPSASLLDGHHGEPILNLEIWPNRSLPRAGFRALLVFTAFMLSIPLIPLLGSPVGLALLPFLLGTLWLLWFFLSLNYRQGARVREVVTLWPDLIRVVRHDPGGKIRRWEANPYWVRTNLRRDAPLENYLTLDGGPRQIELGAFLSPEERLALRDDIDRALGKARSGGR